MLRTEGLGKDYGQLVAVKSLDLEIAPGAFFGLLGPNGAGKTTAISMVAGVVTPTRGKVSVAGHDPRSSSFAARRAIGLVPQDLALYEDLSARENLAFFGRMYGLSGGATRSASDHVLGIAGLADRATEPVARFSGGMKRRLNLAIGLLHEPQLLICDEPTVGVDPQSRAHIFEALRELNGAGTTIVYTSHYMEEVEELCEEVGVMDHGELVALGTMDQLLDDHGGESLELEIEGEADDLAATLDGAEVVHGRIVLPPPDSLQDLVRKAEERGARIRTLERKRSNLETVFLHLTGRELRDDT